MNKFSKLAFIAATAVVAASASAQSVPASRQATNDNWVNGTGEYVWMNGTNELCWRDAFWTPATANAKCDGALVAQAPTPPGSGRSGSSGHHEPEGHVPSRRALRLRQGCPEAGWQASSDDLATKIQGHEPRSRRRDGLHGPYRFGQVQRSSVAAPCASCQGLLGQQGRASEQDLHGRQGQANPVKTDCNQKNRKALIACLAPNRRVEVEIVGTQQAVSRRFASPKTPLRRGFFLPAH